MQLLFTDWGGAGKSQLALDYAEKHKDQYSLVLWIDTTDEEAVRSSFQRCADELGLPKEKNQGSVLTDTTGPKQCSDGFATEPRRTDQWLVIVDNADDVSWGIQKIMPKGKRGSLLITSRDKQAVKLVPGACEQLQVGDMSPAEGAALLLRHLQLDAESASEDVRHGCYKVAQKLGYLALAIDLAGAYIANNNPMPERALSQYLTDYERHRDELLRMDGFRGLLPTQKIVANVWDITLEKIAREYADLQPELLLTFLAHFKGSIVQDEMFRLASLGISEVDSELDDEAGEGISTDLRKYIPVDGGEWDDFRYRQSP